MEYRLNKQALLERLSVWDSFLRKKVSLIACGGTALTLLDVKASTKDVDLIVPDEIGYKYLVGVLSELGYRRSTGAGWERGDGFVFDIYNGKRVHTTELLSSPLEGNIPVKEFGYIYLGVLNYDDILISKLFRGTGVDFEDCLMLLKAKKAEINIAKFIERFKETASYDVSEEKVNKDLDHFLRLLKKEGVR
jgi:hypothetical protein